MRTIVATIATAAAVAVALAVAGPAHANVTPRPIHTVRCTVVAHVTLPVPVDGTRVHPVLLCIGAAGTRVTARLG